MDSLLGDEDSLRGTADSLRDEEGLMESEDLESSATTPSEFLLQREKDNERAK